MSSISSGPVPRQRAARPRGSVPGRVHGWDLSFGEDGPGPRFVLTLAGGPPCRRCEGAQAPPQGTLLTVDGVLRRLDRYRLMLSGSAGGVTITGADPLFQAEFTGALLRSCQDLHVHVALETAGAIDHLDERLIADVLGHADLVLLDIVAGDPDVHRRVTGTALATTLRFAERLAAEDVPFVVRFVPVPGYEAALAAVAGRLSERPGVRAAEVLPRTRLTDRRHQPCAGELCADVPVAKAATVSRAEDLVRDRGLPLR